MALESGFFNSVNGDRKYNAENISRYFEHIMSSGIFKSVTDCFKVSASSGMTLTVAPGAGLIDCHWVRAMAAETVTIPAAHAVLPRFDTVVLRYDPSDSVRAITLEVVSGTPAEEPAAPDPVRTSALHDLTLALVYVPAGASAITSANLTDVRDNEWYCGYVHSLVDTPILKTYHSRYTATMNDTTVAPISIVGFNANTDLLNVYVNGFRMAPGVEYTINETTESITLAEAVDIGTIIDFEAYRPIMPDDDVATYSDTIVTLVEESTTQKAALSQAKAEIEALTLAKDTMQAILNQLAPISPGVFYFDGPQIVPGFVSSTSQRLYFSIPFNRPIDSSNVTVQSMNVQVRQNGTYILGGASAWYDISDALVSATISANGMLTLTFAPSFGETPANNAECIIHIEASATIEFL